MAQQAMHNVHSLLLINTNNNFFFVKELNTTMDYFYNKLKEFLLTVLMCDYQDNKFPVPTEALLVVNYEGLHTLLKNKVGVKIKIKDADQFRCLQELCFSLDINWIGLNSQKKEPIEYETYHAYLIIRDRISFCTCGSHLKTVKDLTHCIVDEDLNGFNGWEHIGEVFEISDEEPEFKKIKTSGLFGSSDNVSEIPGIKTAEIKGSTRMNWFGKWNS